MPLISRAFLTIILGTSLCGLVSLGQVPQNSAQSPGLDSAKGAQAQQARELAAVPRLEGVQFVSNSNSQILLERDGKQYLIDTQAKTIQEVSTQAQTPNSAQAPAPEAKSSQPAQSNSQQSNEKEVYYTEDINLWNLPTAHHLEKK